jgi:6-phosphofructokinase 1
LNAAIRAVTRRALAAYDDQVLGIKLGWDGLIEGNVEPLSLYSVSGILPKGGTILGTSRHNPLKHEDNLTRMVENYQRYEMDAIVVIGGEDTLGVAHALSKKKLNFIGIPKSIDNDLPGTDRSFGFDTAVSIATEAIDRLHSTAEAHHRVVILEVMGRYSGAIATMAGIAGGADCILVPERTFSLEGIEHILMSRQRHAKKFSIIVIAEGAMPANYDPGKNQTVRYDEFGHRTLGGIGEYIRRELENRGTWEVRVAALGPMLRGGSPSVADRVLATRFGVKAADMAHEKKFGYMVALRGTELVETPIAQVLQGHQTVDPHMLELAEVFFG